MQITRATGMREQIKRFRHNAIHEHYDDIDHEVRMLVRCRVGSSENLAALEAARAADKAEIEGLETARAELWRKCRDLVGSLITKSAIIAEQSVRIAELADEIRSLRNWTDGEKQAFRERITELEASQDEVVRRDAERLTWLEENEAHLVSHRESFGVDDPECQYSIWWNVVRDGDSISGHPLGSLREAIDAAVAAAKGGR
ncbi:MAG: hypothetical protein IJI03_12270 [Rudaea sp.]|nr:hypothetical protein [Eggerthellaceae bacterium]MBR0346022.1 hypothetical protein [Rudaea sp.]